MISMIEQGGFARVTQGFHVCEFTFLDYMWSTECKQIGGRPEQLGATASVSSASIIFDHIRDIH